MAALRRTPRPSLTVPAAVLAVAAAAAVAGCTGGTTAWAVDGPLVVSAGSSEDGMTAIVSGTVAYDGTCLTLDGYPVVWPEGTRWDADAEAVVLSGGARAAVGDAVEGGGGYLQVVSMLPEGTDPAAGRLLQECGRSTGEVAFFNLGSRPTVPAAG
ncbi:hypothetical protein [Cellulomonas marina]|uniref:Uncharacterized protein n=1 Tax=Cellulomonas marina TaxID=988821 RepID=A0A1I0XG50_9CELL|nr:hypothetical protein [Cellulomonas marina]GIG29862.1 hypothetical protein Cma02nite_24620 [Cellulomonas marina]SFA99667.1 hypothetical protein SAMN05421867_10517 [Cellulomonas marina]